MEKFEQALSALLAAHSSVPINELISAVELQLMALKEQKASEDDDAADEAEDEND